MQDYKSLHPEVTICDTLVSRHTVRQMQFEQSIIYMILLSALSYVLPYNNVLVMVELSIKEDNKFAEVDN